MIAMFSVLCNTHHILEKEIETWNTHPKGHKILVQDISVIAGIQTRTSQLPIWHDLFYSIIKMSLNLDSASVLH